MIISLDTETTGLDFTHGTKPFLVTICVEGEDPVFWEWDVNPLTRDVEVVKADLWEIWDYIEEADTVVLQNAKFDVAALASVMSSKFNSMWDWGKTHDTLLSSHLLYSKGPHDLTTLCTRYLREDVRPYEATIKQLANECRRWARSNRKLWMISKPGLICMPSAKGEPWKGDMWLPRAIAKERNLPSDHEYWTACSEYANMDSWSTLEIYKSHKQSLQEKGLWDIYLNRLKVLPIAYQMQSTGVTLSRSRLNTLVKQYEEESSAAGEVCVRVATSYGADLKLPKSGNNASLLEAVFDKMELPIVATSKKTGKPSLDKNAMGMYLDSLEGDKLEFMQALANKRKRDTALSYMEGYRKFWKPLDDEGEWYVLHPSLNPTGTDTLRWSSQNPNQQNISKKEGFNLRYCFGPSPGREWWSLDAKNIELRIPAYEAGEEEMVNLFEKPDEPPYYGSNHLLVFDVLHSDRLGLDKDDSEYLLKAKKDYASTWYQWTKNGNFAVQYGAIPSSGTADRAYHLKGAQVLVQRRFKRIAKLNRAMIKQAEEYGYVETMPDKTVSKRGYPLYCTKDERGNVLPTVPLNYHVQGSAMWWMQKAMIRCYEYLQEYNRKRIRNQRCHMIMQVHDELVFDLPAGKDETTNKPIIDSIARLMEKGGEDLGLPTPVSKEYHSNNWSE